MKTQQLQFLDFLAKQNTQFTIPVYQRIYSWTKTQCEELAEDIMRAGSGGTTHFLSMTLYMENTEDAAKEDAKDGASDNAAASAASATSANGANSDNSAASASGTNSENSTTHLDIIDGQQRIATTTIMLTALRDFLEKSGVCVKNIHENAAYCNETIKAKDIHNKFLVTVPKDELNNAASEQSKVRLIGPDKDTLDSLIFKSEKPTRPSRRITDNYQFFMDFFASEDFDVNVFWSGVCELIIISAQIDQADKAQTIFEGLNTKGIPLTAADLIRNYLLVAQTREEQERLYTEYWKPMEIMFEDDILSSGSLKLNTGLRMWLAIRFKKMCISDRSRTYYYFKRYMETEYTGTVEDLLDELRSFCYMWAENYKFNEGRMHCSKFAWAKKGRPLTIAERQVAAGFKARARRAAEAAYNKEAHRQSSMAGNEVTALLPNFHRGMI